jgi:RHS repeat-associated protein
MTWVSDLSEPDSVFPTGGAQTGKNPRLSSILTTLDDNSQSQVTMQYDNSVTPITLAATQPFTGSGSVTDKKETDFGATAPGPLIRETVTSYTSLGNHILGLPTDVSVKNGSGKVVSHAVMSYDGAVVQTESPLPPGHDNTNYLASSTIPRGNLTSSTSYANPTGNTGGVTTSYAYDMTGNKVLQQSGCCTSTAWNYSSATNYAYPDSVVVGPSGSQLTTSFTYFLGTGEVATSTDWNGKTTTYVYDIDGRATSVQGPDGITLSSSYDDTSANPGATNSSSANNLATTHIADFMGHPLADEVLNGSSLVSTVTSINDLRGRPLQISNPYGPGDTPVYTSYGYDGLGRKVATTPPAVGSAAQASYTNTITGFVSTGSDPANQQTRKYSNVLGQIVRVDQPGLSGASAASASVTLSGTEQSVPSASDTNGATAGTATATIAGPERTIQVLTHSATTSSVTLTIGGTDGTNFSVFTHCTQGTINNPPHCTTTQTNFPDAGTIGFTMSVSGTTIPVTVNYSGGLSPANLATALFNAFPANSLVTMSNPNGGSTVTFTTAGAGTAANTASIATSAVSSCVHTGTFVCGGVGWTMTLSGPGLAPTKVSPENFTGGSDNIFTPHPDTGTVTLSFIANGTTFSKQSTYGQSSTANSIALDLYNKFNGDPTVAQVVRLTQPGTGPEAANQIGFTTIADGVSTNYPISATSVTTDTADYTAGSTSFPISLSGATFTPGADGTLFDSGTITVAVNGLDLTAAPSKQITYGQGSNAPGLASQLAALIHNDGSFPVDASVSAGSSTITLTARAQGADANAYAVSITGASSFSSSFPLASFASPADSSPMAGGSNGSASLDPSVASTTTNIYDPYGRLLQATAGQQTRTYIYDGLGRLTTVATPETGGLPVTYTYTDFGAIAQKEEPRVVPGTNTPITTTYSYDGLNRVKTVTYNDSVTPNETYTYNAPNSANNTGGRLASVTNGVETKSYQYDVMGRITQCLETIGANSYTVNYAYTADGQVSSITYPSQLKVNYSYDQIGHLTQVGTAAQNVLTINSSDYTAAGAPLAVTYGNNVKATFAYNNQLQQTLIQYGGPAPAAPLFSLTYSYGGATDNGQIQGITDNVVPSRSTSYVYDALGRLQSAQTVDQASPGTWRLDYAYDRYGNRLSQSPAGGAGSMPPSFTSVDPATNHVQGMGVVYDAVGNIVSDGLNNFQFDANNHLVATNSTPGLGNLSTSLGYGPDGMLVNKNGTLFIYANGSLVAEYANGAAPASPTAEYVNLGGQQVARLAGGAMVFNFQDHLSTRVNADISGNVVRTYGHFPYGETAYETGTPNDFKFTSYRRDPNTGLDDADARYYSSRLGRFMSIDPVLGDNRYAYVSNDPINLVDPTGLFACTTDPFHSASPLCAPGQPGSGGSDNSQNCGGSFNTEGGFDISIGSGCNSFAVNFDGGMGGQLGNVQSALQTLLQNILPIDTCPGGTFECPDDGSPLFGNPDCGQFCVSDAQSNAPISCDTIRDDFVRQRNESNFRSWATGWSTIIPIPYTKWYWLKAFIGLNLMPSQKENDDVINERFENKWEKAGCQGSIHQAAPNSPAALNLPY